MPDNICSDVGYTNLLDKHVEDAGLALPILVMPSAVFLGCLDK